MTPAPPRSNRRKRMQEQLGVSVETALILGCILFAIVIAWWAA